MPKGGGGRGGKKNFKGKRRVFTSAEEIQRQNEEERKQRQWREQKEDNPDSKDDKEEGGSGDSESSEDSSSEEEVKAKGVSHMIEIENPNRALNKTKKVRDLDLNAKTSLSRREREEIQKQESTARYQELHAQGKTQEAMSDLARLSIIRKQREDAARKREEEKKAKEAATAAAASMKGKS